MKVRFGQMSAGKQCNAKGQREMLEIFINSLSKDTTLTCGNLHSTCGVYSIVISPRLNYRMFEVLTNL